MKNIFLFILISLIIVSCGSNENDLITFIGSVDDTNLSGNLAPSYNSSSEEYEITAVNIETMSDTVVGVTVNKAFNIVLPRAGNYIFYAKGKITNKTLKMLTTAVNSSVSSDTINFKSTVLTQYLDYLYVQNDTSVTSFSNINNNLSSYLNSAKNLYNASDSILISSDTTYSNIEKTNALLLKTILTFTQEEIKQNVDLTVNSQFDSSVLSNYADTYVKNFRVARSDTLYLGIKTIKSSDLADSISNILSSSDLVNSVKSIVNLNKTFTNKIFVTTSVYGQSGALTIIDLNDISNVIQNTELTSTDNFIKYYDGKIYILNRSSDNIQVIDAATYKTINQYNVEGSNSNPHDIVFVSSTEAYVSLYGKNYIVKINPLTGEVSDSISLSIFVDSSYDSDGKPEMDRMVLVNNKLFISLESLYNWSATGHSSIAVYDITNDTFIDADTSIAGIQPINLNGDNPYENMQYNTITGKIYISSIGSWYGLSSKSMIEEINPLTYKSKILVRADVSGGTNVSTANISTVQVFNSSKGAFIQYIGWGNNRLLYFNPTTGEITNTDVFKSSANKNLKDLKYDSDGNLYILEQTYGSEGLVKITKYGTVLKTVSTGMPPNYIYISE